MLAASPAEADDANPGGLTEPEARKVDLAWGAGLIALMALVFASIAVIPGAAVPVLVSLAAAFALDPAADFLERRGLSRTLAVLALFLAIGLAMGGALLYLVPALGGETGKLPAFFRGFTARFEEITGRPLPADIKTAVASLSQRSGGLGQTLPPRIVGLVMGALSSTATALVFLFGLAVIPVITFHLLRDYDHNVRWVRDLLPRRYEPLLSRRFAEVGSVLGGFIHGQLTVGAILTCLYSLGLAIAGLDLAVVIGVVAGFGTMVPYIGPGVGMALAVLSLIVSWQDPFQAVTVAATFALGMGAEGLYITPRIVGGKVGLSPVLVMIAILVFGNLFGFAGVLLAVPTSAALKVVTGVALFRYRRSRGYLG